MDFQGMKRKKLQALCKKHGIPANLKNIEMANRLSTLFKDQPRPVRSKTMSDILSRCSVTESQRDGASVDDESLVEEEEKEMEISTKECCMSVGHCVGNPESELGLPTDMEIQLSANRHGDLSEQALLMGEYGLDEEGKEEEHTTATESPDVLNTNQNEGVSDLHDESKSVASLLLRQSCVGDFNGDGLGRNEGNMTTELHCGSGAITTSSNRRSLLGSFVAENSGGSKSMELSEAEVQESSAECWNKIHSSKDDEKGSLDKELQSANLSEYNSHENSNEDRKTMDEVNALELSRSLSALSPMEEKSLEKDKVNALSQRIPVNNAASSVLGEPAVFTNPERNLFMMEQLSQNGKKLAGDSVDHHSDEAVESHGVLLLGDYGIDEVGKQVDCDNFTGANTTAKSHDMSDLLAASESQSIMGDSEPHTAGKQEREEVEFKDESALFTWFETCLLLEESAHGKHKPDSTHHDSSAKVILKGDNTAADSSGSIASKVFYSHEFNAGEETVGADFISKGSLAEYVHSENLFDLDIDGADTTMYAEKTVSFNSYVLAGTCSLVPEESSPLTYSHDQVNDVLEELAITDELIETKVTTQGDDKGSLMLDSSGGSRRMMST